MTYPIPKRALEHHVAFLGKTGSGKTTASKAGIEIILDSGGRVCVLDPTGAWWGMKSSATGKSAGYPFVIFGGLHADFPLGATHGEAVAEIVGTSNTPAIIDTSQMRVSERTRFFTDFADAIMRKNRGPLHLVVDEAHVFMPQGKVPDPQSGQMLAAGNNMVSGGRSRGLRITLISQRPAKLHKDSLTQVETLVAMRLIAPQDRNAVEEWISDNADEKVGREIISTLATLKTGEAWVWSPECDVLERVKFPRIRTFDSSAAPAGFEETGVVLAPVDSDTIRERLTKIAAEVVANDPKALKVRIAELERDLKKPPAVENREVEAAEERGFSRGLAYGQNLANNIRVVLLRMTDANDAMLSCMESIRKQTNGDDPGAKFVYDGARAENPTRSGTHPVRSSPSPARPAPRARQIDARAPSIDLPSSHRKVLAVLAAYGECDSGRLALLSGYTYSGGFRNILASLRTSGYIEGDNTGTMRITDAGEDCGPFDPLPRGEALREHWLNFSQFGAAEKDVLRALLDRPGGFDGHALAAHVGREYSGGFRNTLSRLRTAGVLVGKNTGVMTASEELLA